MYKSLRLAISFCVGIVTAANFVTLTTAQSIIPAADRTGTRIQGRGNVVDITGGSLSRDGANLFHSFQQFNVPVDRTANFISSPNIQNILSRVTGGSPSVINGLIQVTGSHSNLFLINPAGIVFGNSASLNVPAAFTAITANQVGFGNNNWLNSFGENNYQNLLGTPNQFVFNTPIAGSIVNTGNLTLNPGQNLTLLGGAIVNTGNLTSPGGNITLMAVPGSNLVRLSQPGNLLSLEVTPPTTGIIRPLSLPQLLTGTSDITRLILNSEGTLLLAGISVPLDQGNTIISGRIDTANRDINFPKIPRIQVLGERIALLNSVLNASGVHSGGTILVGGEYLGQGTIPTAQFTFADANTRINANGLGNAPGGRVIAWADRTTRFFGTINARGGSLGGNGGFIETSGKINLDVSGIRINASSSFGSPGLWLLDPTDINIVPGGGFTGGTFPGGIFTPDGVTNPATIGADDITGFLGVGTSVEIRTNPGPAGGNGDININTPLNINPSLPNLTLSLFASRDINVNQPILVTGNPLNLSFNTTPGGNVNINAAIGIQGGNFTANLGGTFFTNSPITTLGGDFIVNADNSVITTSSINTSSPFGNSGNINIRAISGGISTGNLISNNTFTGLGGVAGSVTLNAASDILVETIDSSSTGSPSAIGGAIDITTNSLFRANNTTVGPPFCGTFSLCSYGNAINGSGSITIRHQGGTTSPFVVGGGVDNGTFGAIVSDIPFTPGPVPVSPLSTTVGRTTIIINVPPPPPIIDPSFFLLFRNPEAPPTPDPVVVGEPIVEQPPELPIPPPPPEQPPDPPIIPPPPPEQPPDPPIPPGLTLEQGTQVARDLQLRDQPLPIQREIPSLELDMVFGELERSFTKDFEDFLGLKASQDLSFEEVQRSLQAVRAETGIKPAIVYLFFSKTNSDPNAPKNNQAGRAAVERSSQFPSPDDQLEILVILETGEPIRKSVEVSRREVVNLTNRFRSEITAYRTNPRAYLAPSQQLYKWLLAPIEKDLQDKEIDNLNFILDQGLRSLPMAALHNGEKFLVEQYSLAMMPSLNLTDLRYRNIKTAPILAMGATTFENNNPLPAVGLELAEITKERGSTYFLNEQFTATNLRQQHQQQGRQILHLATHGLFQGDSLNDSYIQLWDRRLTLGELPELGLSNPVIDLLVLSACQTALGNREAELGFAGLAVQAGVRSSIASLWEVSDEATLGLMTDFYDQLTTAPIKAEAVRRTQLALLQRSVRLESGNLVSETRSTPLTRELAALGDRNFSHPYFWSAFTLVGNPW